MSYKLIKIKITFNLLLFLLFLLVFGHYGRYFAHKYFNVREDVIQDVLQRYKYSQSGHRYKKRAVF